MFIPLAFAVLNISYIVIITCSHNRTKVGTKTPISKHNNSLPKPGPLSPIKKNGRNPPNRNENNPSPTKHKKPKEPRPSSLLLDDEEVTTNPKKVPSPRAKNQVSADTDEKQDRMAAEKYASELTGQGSKSPKDPEYTDATYIKGPFSPYSPFRRKPNKRKNRDPGADWQSEALKWLVGSSNSNTSPQGNNNTNKLKTGKIEPKVQWWETVTARDIPQDQLHPHKLRKDRQVKNPHRKVFVQNRIKEMGGYLKTKEIGKYIMVKPGGETIKEVTVHSEIIENTPIAVGSSPSS